MNMMIMKEMETTMARIMVLFFILSLIITKLVTTIIPATINIPTTHHHHHWHHRHYHLISATAQFIILIIVIIICTIITFRVVIINLIHVIPFWTRNSPKTIPIYVWSKIVLLPKHIQSTYWLVWIGWTELHAIDGVRWRLLHAPPRASPTWWRGDVPHTRSRIPRKAALRQKRHPAGENCWMLQPDPVALKLQPTHTCAKLTSWDNTHKSLC